MVLAEKPPFDGHVYSDLSNNGALSSVFPMLAFLMESRAHKRKLANVHSVTLHHNM